jgi:hypothetical protein
VLQTLRYCKSLKDPGSLGALMCLFTALFAAPSVHADQRRTCGIGISLQLSDAYEVLPQENSSVPCRVRHVTRGLPTFNVIMMPGVGPHASRRSEREFSATLLDSYRNVGLTDATLNDGRYVHVGGREAFKATITYSNQALRMRSIVVAFEGVLESYILTATQTEADFLGSEADIEQVVSSIQLPALPEEQREADRPVPRPLIIPWLFAFAVAGFLWWRAKKRAQLPPD